VDEASVAAQATILRKYANAQGWAVVIDIQETLREHGARHERDEYLAAAQ